MVQPLLLIRSAELISYQDQAGVEYIWTGDSTYWNGHAPVLFPIIGALKDDKTEIDGQHYNMPKHGFARRKEFAVSKIEESKVIFNLSHDSETIQMYPFQFELRIQHELSAKGFTTTYHVANTDHKPILFCIGGHVGFRCPINQGELFSDYELEFSSNENCRPYYINHAGIVDKQITNRLTLDHTNALKLNYSDFDHDALIFDKLKSRKVKLLNRSNGTGIEFSYDGFDVLGIWTPPHKKAPFICIEPWIGMPATTDESGQFQDKPYIIHLPINQTFKASYSMNII